MKLSAIVVQPSGQVGHQAAGADVAGHQPRAAHHLEEIEQYLALAEAVEEGAHRAEVERLRAEPDEVVVDARQLGQQDADRPSRARARRCPATSRSAARRRDCSRAARGSPSGRSAPPLGDRSWSRKSSRSRCAGSRSPARSASPSRPSRSSTRRNTPCVLGCCGPMLIVMESPDRITCVPWYRASVGAVRCHRFAPVVSSQ